mmetsp:Transcript_69746/g.116196  ORF Transcript_69746/g.116196 Transcript_69746/m.116196 type:complete len:84 (-) Transcript_69746:1078-1329(-)
MYAWLHNMRAQLNNTVHDVLIATGENATERKLSLYTGKLRLQLQVCFLTMTVTPIAVVKAFVQYQFTTDQKCNCCCTSILPYQ